MFWKEEIRLCVPLTGAESHRGFSSRISRRARAMTKNTVSFCKSHNQCEDAKKKKEDLEVNVISANPKPYVLSRSDLISCRGRQENPKASTCVFPSTGRTMTVDGICFDGLYNKWEAGEEKEEDLTVNFIPTLQSPCSLLPCSLRRAENIPDDEYKFERIERIECENNRMVELLRSEASEMFVVPAQTTSHFISLI
jgi:hypothetical protein